MNYLIYISTAKKLMNDAELSNILKVSRANNLQDQITGVLMYNEGTFIQLLEGEVNAINSTFEVISADIRHKNVLKLMEGSEDDRLFPDWTMGFKTINVAQAETLQGYFNPRKKAFDPNNTHAGLTIIKTFAESN